MSHRFPPLASQYELTGAHRRRQGPGRPALVLALAQVPSLPWFELLLGAAFLMALGAL